MNLLVITACPPYPLDSGARIRAFEIIRHLSRKYRISILTLAHTLQDFKNLEELRPYCVYLEAIPHSRTFFKKARDLLASFKTGLPYVVAANTNSSLQKRIAEVINEQNIDLVQIEELYAAGNIFNCNLNRPYFFDAYNCEALILRRLAQARPFSLRSAYWNDQAGKLAGFEKDICAGAEYVFCVSPNEVDYFKTLARRVKLIANGATIAGSGLPGTGEVQPGNNSSAQQILFTGTLSYPPNVDGILYFLRSIWTKIKRECPHATFIIVGRRPPIALCRAVRQAGEGVQLSTEIDEISPFFANSAAMVVPLRAGAGTRLKILQAFAHRLPVISTTIGAEGLSIENGKEALIADNPGDFARAVIRVLNEKGVRAELVQNGVDLIQEKYQWSDIVEGCSSAYGEIGF